MSLTLHLFRHGVAAGVHGRCIGQTDAELSAEGRAASERIARAWPHARPARLVASPLARALDSAAPLAQAWGLDLETDSRLAEMDFGRWEGRTWAEIEAEDSAALAAWMADWTHTPAPGGESFASLQARTDAWLAEIEIAAEASAEGDIVAVAHAGTIRALLVRVLGLDPAHAFRLDVQHSALTTVRLSPPALVCLNRPL